MWGDLFSKPVFVLTSDQDWAPTWAAEAFLAKTENLNIPLHVFRTNPCKAFDAAARAGKISQGWHPNFLPGSSHGDDADGVISYMLEHFGAANTVRSHAFVENTYHWKKLRQAGVLADSQLATLYQPFLQPLLHWTGITRFPIFFEDDIFFEYEPDTLNLGRVKSTLFTPGLKILNFHATFYAINAPSSDFYSAVKSSVFSSSEAADALVWQGRGTKQVFDELVEMIRDDGHHFMSFPQLLTEALKHVTAFKGAI